MTANAAIDAKWQTGHKLPMQRMRIDRLGHRGDGIAPGPVYVPNTLPGEEVEGQVIGNVMVDPRIVAPVPARVAPPCRHARRCGGCQLQHADPDFTARWKTDVVRRALEAHGLQAEIEPVITSAPQSRRRAAFSARRTKKGALAGFHRKRSDEIVAVPDCRVVTPALAAALPVVEALAILGASRKAALSALVTETLTGLDIAVCGGKAADTDLRSGLAGIARAHDLARVIWDDEVITRRAPVIRFGGTDVSPPPGAFLQATRDGEAALQAQVLEALRGARAVADLFAGCGTFALPLAETAAVHAVESEAAMLAALDAGWRHGRGLRGVTTERRDLFRNPLLSDTLTRFDGLVIDPPRVGAEAQMTQIARARVPRIAHVSCNPVTFARDCATLVAQGYRLGPVSVVDQFRWSAHVELVAGLFLEE